MKLGLAAAVLWIGVPAVAPAAGCERLDLRELAQESGIDFVHRRGAAGRKQLPETMGAGAAWLDYDGDGWQDLYLVQSGPFPPDGSASAADRLFRNLGDGTFADVTAPSGAGSRGYGQGALAADLDGSGAVDLVVTAYGRLALLRNRGDGTFEEATATAGLELDGWLSSAAAGDADGDGDLDLYVSRYLEFETAGDLYCGDPETGERRYCDPSLFLGSGDRFFRNRGEGRFEDATGAAGLSGADGRGLGVVFTDLDGDGSPDLYVANDLTLNLFFRNLGQGSFEDLSLPSGAAANGDGKPEAGMGLAVADVDGDGDPDLAVTNFDVETNTLYENLAAALFADVAAISGFGPPSFNLLAFGIVAADFDRDGRVDFYVGNGHIFERPKRDNTSYRQRDQLLMGAEEGRFRELRCAVLEASPDVSRGVAAADYDNDGDPDVAVQNNGGRFRLLRNGVEEGGWLGVVLRGGAANRQAVGARLALRSAQSTQTRWVLAGDSYQSSSDQRQLFGGVGGTVERLEVTWPSGRRRCLLQPPAQRYLVIPEPAQRSGGQSVSPRHAKPSA